MAAGAGVWEPLVEAGRLAPSGHNTQPWLVHPLSPHEAELLYVPARLLPVEDPGGRFTSVFLGAFVEAMNVAASSTNHNVALVTPPPALDMSTRGAPRTYGRLAIGAGATTDLDARLLGARRTSRLPYDGRAVPEDAIEELTAVASSCAHEARFFTDVDTVSWVVRLNADVVFYDLREGDRRREIGEWVRHSNRAARERGDGFSPACLGFPGPLLWAFFEHHELVANRVVQPLLHRLYLRSMRGTSIVGWLKARWQTPAECFDAGRMLLRFWLTLTKHGLVMQPFGSVITNARSHAELLRRTGEQEDGREVWLLFRAGYSGEPPQADRLPAKALLA